jgi:hypothetical protein
MVTFSNVFVVQWVLLGSFVSVGFNMYLSDNNVLNISDEPMN